MVNLAIPEKWQAMKKKGQAETCPYPQKEAKMKTYIAYHENLSGQAKSSRTYVLLHKTMAAGVIAHHQNLDHHKIDRSGAVSRDGGETEKRFNKIFLKAWPKTSCCFSKEPMSLWANDQR